MREITQKLDSMRKNNSTLDEKIHEKEKFQTSIKKRAGKIRQKVNNMNNDEVQRVGPYLWNIFVKMIKHTNLKGFDFSVNNARETKTKLAFIDPDNNPILNIISDGQLGAFMLSYLLGNAFLRKDIGSFHCYFIDDITNSMDDINLVSFVDFIKYQLAESKKENGENAAIEQFFFSTCDGNLKRMFQYKMEGFEIPVRLIDLDRPELANAEKI